MKILRIIRRVLALAIGFWALALTVFYLFFARISFESTTATEVPGQPQVTTTTTGQLPWLSQVGPLAVAVMLLFSLLLAVIAVAEWRGGLWFSAPLTLLALVGTFITGFSIGGLYFPGAVAAALGLLLLAAQKLASRPDRPIS